MISLNIQFAEGIASFGRSEVKKVINVLNSKPPTKLPAGNINVRITSSSEVKRLNQQYAGKNEATDVLSFTYAENSNQQTAGSKREGRDPSTIYDLPISNLDLGDIVISYSHLKRQAKLAGTNQATELALLVLHGVLHILGYDHRSQPQQRRFDQLQRQVMEAADLRYRSFSWPS